MSKTILTYSALRLFQNCRRKYHLRYNEYLVPLKADEILYLGSVWHSVMELWYGEGDRDAKLLAIRHLIDKSFPNHNSDPSRKRDWHLCHAMFDSYRARYPEEDFQMRRAELIAKSKSGKSTAKRRLPESDEEFRARLTEKYRDPAMFHREVLYLSRQDTDRTQREVWELSQQILAARRRGFWSPNWDSCFHFGSRPCGYWALCRSNGNPIVQDNLYTYASPNEELSNENEPETIF